MARWEGLSSQLSKGPPDLSPKFTQQHAARKIWSSFLVPFIAGALRGTRTPDPLLRRQMLYPAELSAHMERVMGIEPTQPAWKAGILPLNYTRRNGHYYNQYLPISQVFFIK